MVNAEAEAPGTPARPRKAIMVLAVTLCIVLGSCLGTVGGLVGGRAAAKFAAPDPIGPTALPPIPEKVPSGSDQYLTRLTVSHITKDFAKRAKFTCNTKQLGQTPDPAGIYFTSCDAPEGVTASVMLWHDGEAKVKAVEAECRLPLGTPLCRTLAGGIAELAIVEQPDVAKRTAAWAAENVDRDATTVIGGVRLTATLDGHFPSMRIAPAE
ncbi:hypothetical protein [Krasilnikovia sp. M28-CT-15]|uniref:hypothetical protein n=1 Tax=Krasilnikovia sp. M28-CT-15 TaxID=3373540 RepID=UPI00387744A0